MTDRDAVRHLRDELASWEPQLIATARRHGTSWASLAPSTGPDYLPRPPIHLHATDMKGHPLEGRM